MSRVNNFKSMKFLVFALTILLLLPDVWGQQTTDVSQKFDGNWWKIASASEKTGFLYALDDCLTYDAKPAIWHDDTFIDSEQKISRYYESSPSNGATSVQQVFEHFGKTKNQLKSTQSEGRYGDEFWRAHDESARRGFIEGYISCRVQYKHSPKWSKPTDYYLQRLDDMYNADDRHGESAPEFAGSVASALQQIVDSHQ